MIENKIAAIFLEPGTSMYYFAGVRWGLSERYVRMVIPAKARSLTSSRDLRSSREELSALVRTFAFGRKTKAPARSWPGC